MERSLAGLITDETLVQKLENAGYESISDIKDAGVVSVIKELALSADQVKIILQVVHGGQIVASQTAEDRIKADSKIRGVSFSCTAFDHLFDRYKGVPPSCITDFCGEPGTGKTQICMQLAVNAGECIYIDTEGSVFPSRLRQYAESAIAAAAAAKKKNDSSNNDNENDVDSLLRKIHLFRICDHFQLVAFIQQLPSILDELNQIKLIILDSVTYPLRMNVDLRLRINILAFLGQTLAQLASRHKIPVVVTNHVTEDRLNEAMTPALGDDWGRRVANRFLLYRSREARHARYYKSSLGVPETFIRFQITDEGLKDVSTEEEEEEEEEYDKGEKVEAGDNNSNSDHDDNEREVEDMVLTQPLGNSNILYKQQAEEDEDDGDDDMIITQPVSNIYALNKQQAEEEDDEDDMILTQPQTIIINGNEEEEDVWESSHFTDQIISQLPSQVSSASSLLQDEVDNEQNQRPQQRRNNDKIRAEEEKTYLRTPESLPSKRNRSDETEEDEAVPVHKKASNSTTASPNTTTTPINTTTTAAAAAPFTKEDDDVEYFGWSSEDEEDLLFLEAYKYSSAF